MKNLILSYAQDLNDAFPGYEFSIWSREQLLGYFNDALCLIAAQRPDLFSELKVIEVGNCEDYLELCDCLKVLDVLGQSDKDGRHIRPIPRRKEKGTVWEGNKRAKGFVDKISEYDLKPNSNLLRIYPSNLDPTKKFYITVRCSIEPRVYTLDDDAPSERCAFLAAARHWVLYNAKMIDGEFSQVLQSQAKEHREMFLAILTLVERADDKAEAKRDNKNYPQRTVQPEQ